MVKYIGRINISKRIEYIVIEEKVFFFLVGFIIWLNLEVDWYKIVLEGDCEVYNVFVYRCLFLLFFKLWLE